MLSFQSLNPDHPAPFDFNFNVASQSVAELYSAVTRGLLSVNTVLPEFNIDGPEDISYYQIIIASDNNFNNIVVVRQVSYVCIVLGF